VIDQNRRENINLPGSFVGDRRRFQRSSFDAPLTARLGGMPAIVLNLSVAGALVEHGEPIRLGDTTHLVLEWYEEIDVSAQIVRIELVERRHRSALAIENPSASLIRSLGLRQAHDRIGRLQSLVEASKLVNSALEPDSLVEAILSVARNELGVDRGAVYFLDHRTHEIWTERAGREGPFQHRFPIGQGLAGYVAATGIALKLEDAYTDPRFDASVDLLSAFRDGVGLQVPGRRARSMLCVPVRDREHQVVGVLQFLHEQHRSFRGDDLEFLEAISEHIAIAMRNAAYVLDGFVKNRMDTELKLGREIQERLLPIPPTRWSGVDVAASSVPCFEVGGDYHDFLDLPGDRYGLAVGDVSGKGVSAALIMSSAQAALRVVAPGEPDLVALISRLDALLFRTTPPEKFVTFFFASYDRQTGFVRYVNAGHVAPFVCSSGSIMRLDTTGPPLGILQDAGFRLGEVLLEPGATLCVYTDGFTEATNPAGEELGLDRWQSLVLGASHHSAADMCRLLIEETQLYEDGCRPSDDKELIIFRRRE
jgi:phosphoserine phosphatase RsbU/P